MSSQEVVDYCHDVLRGDLMRHGWGTTNDMVKKAMAQYLVTEALKRGSMDNISVVVIWLSKD
jgi:serine/threonine protein phosphatase PrpC